MPRGYQSSLMSNPTLGQHGLIALQESERQALLFLFLFFYYIAGV